MEGIAQSLTATREDGQVETSHLYFLPRTHACAGGSISFDLGLSDWINLLFISCPHEDRNFITHFSQEFTLKAGLVCDRSVGIQYRKCTGCARFWVGTGRPH